MASGISTHSYSSEDNDMYAAIKEKLTHLSVSAIADAVAQTYADRKIPIVTSAVASGKTLHLPAACADKLGECVYVVQPTRNLANNAYETLIKVIGDNNASNYVGVMNSTRSGEETKIHPNNKVIFTTVGYALSSGLMTSRVNIIFDEAHESSLEMSLAKAIVHQRIRSRELVRCAILSATIDAENEVDYWGEDRAVRYHTDGSAYPVEYFENEDIECIHISGAIEYLIKEKKRSGILVFMEGKAEIAEEIELTKKRLSYSRMAEGVDYEVMVITGESDSSERKAACAAPSTPIKLLFGTNVLESGISLDWVDSGISSGRTKQLEVYNGRHQLMSADLPQWRIEQQMGRVARFRPGVFILMGEPMADRPNLHEPDILRLPLSDLVFKATSIPNVHLRELQFSKNETPRERSISEAIDELKAFEMISEDADGVLSLTEDGSFASSLPIGFKAAAVLAEGKRLDMLGVAIPLAAAIEIGDVRHDRRRSLQTWTILFSDIFEAVYAITQVLISDSTVSEKKRCERDNISHRRYREYKDLIRALERKLGVEASFVEYVKTSVEGYADTLDDIKKMLFRSHGGKLYRNIGSGVSLFLDPNASFWGTSVGYSNTSGACRNFDPQFIVSAGELRTFPTRRGEITVLSHVTQYTISDVEMLLDYYGAEHIDPNGHLRAIIEKKQAEIIAEQERQRRWAEKVAAQEAREAADRLREKSRPSVDLTNAIRRATTVHEDRGGSNATLGDILGAALNKK